MITRKSRVSASPVEQLRQFSLNVAKGIDETTSPLSPNTVLGMKNMCVNDDGSLSIRKPILARKCIAASTFTNADNATFEFRPTKTAVLHDKKHLLVVGEMWHAGTKFSQGICILNENRENIALKLKISQYDVDTRTTLQKEIRYDNGYLFGSEYENGDPDWFDVSKFTITRASSATVLGNCRFRLREVRDENDGEFFNFSTYSEGFVWFPRLVRIYQENDEWIVSIVMPVPNAYTTADNKLVNDFDNLLDNPFATRDIYGASIPYASHIVAYSTAPSYTAQNTSNTIIQIPSAYTSGTLTYVDVYNHTMSVTYYINHELSVEEDSDSGKFVRQGNVTLTLERPALPLVCRIRFTWGAYKSGEDASRDVQTYVMNVYFARNQSSATFVSPFMGVPVSATDTDYLAEFRISIESVTLKAFNYASPSTVYDLTENVNAFDVRQLNTMDLTRAGLVYLKAFTRFPLNSDNVYGCWKVSEDGVHWTSALNSNELSITVSEEAYEPLKDVTNSAEQTSTESFVYYPLNATGSGDLIENRVDVLPIEALSTAVSSYKFVIARIMYEEGVPVRSYTYSEIVYTPVLGAEELAVSDLGNAALGKKLYSNGILYSFGHETFRNNILYSHPGETVFPLAYSISLSASGDEQVTAVFPWRNYLMSTTASGVYLSERSDTGFYTKTVNNTIGVPESDSECCVPILNGIILKSGDKVYQLYPNIYGGTESILNVAEISKPIEGLLSSVTYDKAFAFSTNDTYVLVLSDSVTHTSRIFRYDYTLKCWMYESYGVDFYDYAVNSVDSVFLYGTDGTNLIEFYYGKTLQEVFKEVSDDSGDAYSTEDLPYGDILSVETSLEEAVLQWFGGASIDMHAIPYTIDFGQKTDNLSYTKQFTEVKVVFATRSARDSFPMQLLVAIDGDPHVTKRDLATDAALNKAHPSSSGSDLRADAGYLGTNFYGINADADIVNTIRQLAVRYSGKGKSVRYILTGESVADFKLYEVQSRYYISNVKQ